jgi:recombinational DNA repair protein (RecF pathway)
MIRRWGRATLQLTCAGCKRTIEDGQGVAFLRLGEGILCVPCGKAEERK